MRLRGNDMIVNYSLVNVCFGKPHEQRMKHAAFHANYGVADIQ